MPLLEYEEPDIDHIWIVVADGKEAKAWRLHEEDSYLPPATQSQRLIPQPPQTLQIAPVPDAIWHADDRAIYDVGGRQEPKQMEHNEATQARIVACEEVKIPFMKSLADNLEKIAEHGTFARFVFVAPPEMLGEFKSHLSKNLKARLIAMLDKDLIHYEGAELLSHIKDVLSAIGFNSQPLNAKFDRKTA